MQHTECFAGFRHNSGIYEYNQTSNFPFILNILFVF